MIMEKALALVRRTKSGRRPEKGEKTAARRPARDLVSTPPGMGRGVLRGVWAPSVPVLRPPFDTSLSPTSENLLMDRKDAV